MRATYGITPWAQHVSGLRVLLAWGICDHACMSGVTCAHTEIMPENQVDNKAEGDTPYSGP